MSRKENSPTELQRALARADIDIMIEEVDRSFRFYKFAFDGGERLRPREDIPEELEPYVLPYDMPQGEREEYILAAMMLVLSRYDDDPFIDFWAWGDFWSMLVIHNVSDATLARIELEARRTPRFRWMLTLVRIGTAPAHVQESIRRARGSATDQDPMPARPF